MYNTIDAYLRDLKKELRHLDRAVAQDALADAEEYLRTAVETSELAEAEALQQIVDRYGAPAEVAAGYAQLDVPPQAPLPVHEIEPASRHKTGFFGIVTDIHAWGALFYMIISLITGIFYFTWTITGISLSLGTIILIISIPFIGLFLLSVRGLALIEGKLVEALLGVRMPHRPLFIDRSLSVWGKFKCLVLDGITWKAMLYQLLQMPLGVIYFTLCVTLLATSLGCLLGPLGQMIFGYPIQFTITNITFMHLPLWLGVVSMLCGGLLFFLSLHLARFLGRMHGAYAKIMLVR